MKTHGMSSTKLYYAWQATKTRCYNKGRLDYKYYGGRGIKVCDRWLNSFENFREDMGSTWKKGLSIDRIDVDGNYEPGNCRWVHVGRQSGNRRSNRLLTFEGKTKTIADWAELLGMSRYTLYYRMNNGWSVKTALTTTPYFFNRCK